MENKVQVDSEMYTGFVSGIHPRVLSVAFRNITHYSALGTKERPNEMQSVNFLFWGRGATTASEFLFLNKAIYNINQMATSKMIRI